MRISLFLFQYLTSQSLVSQSNGWPSAEKNFVELDEVTTHAFKSGRIVYSCLNSMREIQEDDFIHFNGSAARVYNWEKIFNILLDEFKIILSQKTRLAVTTGSATALDEVLAALHTVITDLGA